MRFQAATSLGLCLALFLVTGCGGKSGQGSQTGAPDHEHGPGPKGGAVADLGKYHAEFKVDHKTKQATVYIWGEDLKNPKATPIKADSITLVITNHQKHMGELKITLEKKPMEGETDGSSRFVGGHDALAHEQEYSGIIKATVDGKDLEGKFEEKPGQ